MIICIYGEPLKLYTTSNPMRGWVKELIRLRTNDSFIIALRDKPVQFSSFFKELESFENVTIQYLSFSKKISNLLALFGLPFYNALKIRAAVCIGAGDPDYFYGFKGKTVNFLADLSSLRNQKSVSLKWHGKIIQKNILKFGIKHAEKTVCISDYTKNDLADLYPQYAQKFITVYNGISDLWFDESYIDNKTAETFKNLHGNYFIWWGAISPRKNLVRLLKAYKDLIRDFNSPPKLLIIGDVVIPEKQFDFLLKELDAFVIKLPFQDFKVLKGYIKESIGLVFPSLFEGFGLPVIEAYALGKNVLYSDVTSLPEVANNLGIELNPLSVDSVKTGLLKLFNNQDTFAEQRKNYARQFTYKNAANKLSKIINNL